MARKLYIVGNWKMYKTAREATDYIEALAPQVQKSEAKIFLSVPFTSIAPAAHYAKDTNIVIGAQNMNDAREGAFTGEIAGLMLKEAGAAFVILGHSERRHLFGETNALIHKKILRAFQDDLQPILCIGETLKEREAKKTEQVLKEQLVTALEGIPKEDAANLIIAYEPVWAIGTGKTATGQLVQEAHEFCRSCLVELFGKKTADQISILYGGSVKPENSAELMALQDVDGVLVGGASLDPQTFAHIAAKANSKAAPKSARKTPSKTIRQSPHEKSEPKSKSTPAKLKKNEEKPIQKGKKAK